MFCLVVLEARKRVLEDPEEVLRHAQSREAVLKIIWSRLSGSP
jgi:hypothetical protein